MSPRLLFQIHPSSGVPIYRQLMDQVKTLAAAGKFGSDDLLPSVRQIAEELQINPMTVSKAYSLLERDGVLERVRGQGMKLSSSVSNQPTVRQKQQSLKPLLEQVAAQARQLELTQEQVLSALSPLLKDLKND
ncbi:MAG: GntR family transcriptional regulator [Planctomycetaceae bacterium]|nr:GntR family transcriptional regulator [Planctomycetaceae bacterium]